MCRHSRLVVLCPESDVEVLTTEDSRFLNLIADPDLLRCNISQTLCVNRASAP